MRLIALASFLILASQIAPAAATNTDRCTAVVDNYTYRPGDKSFVQVVGFLNSQVSGHVVTQGSNPLALKATKPIDLDIEGLRVEVSTRLCGSALVSRSTTKTGPGMRANVDCNDAGCAESLPPDFDAIPPSGTVSISNCGRGAQTTSSYRKESDGTFIIFRYETRRANQCDPV